MDKKTELSVEGILAGNKKTSTKDLRIGFKCDKFEIDINSKVHRLDGKKILADRYEEMYQSLDGTRCVAKKVGYNNGTLAHFPAMQNEKGKWVADTEQQPIPSDQVNKVIMDLSTGLTAKKDTNKGLWFNKLVGVDVMNNWLVETTYNIFSEENSDRWKQSKWLYSGITHTERPTMAFSFHKELMVDTSGYSWLVQG